MNILSGIVRRMSKMAMPNSAQLAKIFQDSLFRSGPVPTSKRRGFREQDDGRLNAVVPAEPQRAPQNLVQIWVHVPAQHHVLILAADGFLKIFQLALGQGLWGRSQPSSPPKGRSVTVLLLANSGANSWTGPCR